MSSVKITQLNSIGTLNANTSNTIFVGVDVSTGLTGRISAHTLAQGLFSQESLNVGNNAVIFPSTIAQFAGNSANYLQVNLQNFTPAGSGDYVISADISTDTTNYLDLGINNSTYSDPLYNATKKLDGYLFVQGPATTGSGGNLVIGTATTLTNLIFIVGGTTANNIVAKMTANGLTLNTQSYITYADGSVQSTAASPYAYSNVIFAQSNASFLRTNTVFAQSNTVFVQANVSFAQSNASFAQANAAFLKANNAIANTGSINANSVIANTATLGNLTLSNNQIYSSLTNVDMVIGQTSATANLIINRTTNVTKDLTITGNITVQGTFLDFNNSSFNPNVAFIQITGSDNGITVPPSNSSYMLQITGKANTSTRVALDSFGAGSYPVLFGRLGRGSAAAPLAVANNDVLFRIAGNGYTGTQFSGIGPSRIDFVAAENFSDTTKGTRIELWNTTLGSNTIQKIATFNADTVSFTGTVVPQKGFTYTPTIYAGNQTAITIDVANTSVIKANTTAGLVVTLSNLSPGKEVLAWIVNAAGTNQTFTHGLSALNSTINATTYNIPGTSTILVRYMCMDATLANAFVAITHA